MINQQAELDRFSTIYTCHLTLTNAGMQRVADIRRRGACFRDDYARAAIHLAQGVVSSGEVAWLCERGYIEPLRNLAA